MLANTPLRPPSLSKIQFKIFWFVARRPQGVTRQEIFDFVYGGREDGGPYDKVVEVHLNHINKKLAPSGLIIRRDPPRKQREKFQLRRTDNGHIWLPYV